jgi:predicted dehydrogenase
MRVAFIGVSHWHAPLYYRPAGRLGGVRIVGVSDDDADVAERVGREVGARAFVSITDLLEDTRPEFAFAFGRHRDMPSIAATLIDARVPFVLEKPGGLNAAQVQDIRDRAHARNLYAGTGFNFRASDWFARLRALTDDDPATHASFTFISGGPTRYHELGSPWMLDPAASGGGSTINLASHFIDMFRVFTQSDPTEVTALMGHHTWQQPVEDYSVVTLRSPRAVGKVETGYTYPAGLGFFDQHFSLRTRRTYVVVRNDDTIKIHDAASGHSATANTPWYPAFVSESLRRFERDLPPLASLDDLVAAMRVIDAAYASDRAHGVALEIRY